jgi:hypothetical protein
MKTLYLNIPGEDIISSPIIDEIQIEAVSEFSDFASLVPSVDQVVTILTAYSSTGGTVSGGLAGMRAVLDAQRWTKTLPTRIQVTLHFFVKTNPKVDVADKMNTLLGLHILREDPTQKGKFYLPGISMRNANTIYKDISGEKIPEKKPPTPKDKDEEKLLANTKSAVFSLLIPGVVYLPYAYISAITPKWGNQETASKIPLWARADVTFSSVGPSQSRHFTDGVMFSNDPLGFDRQYASGFKAIRLEDRRVF